MYGSLCRQGSVRELVPCPEQARLCRTITAEGNGMSYKLASKDRKNFDIILNDATVGHIKTKIAVSGDLQYDLDIENTAFDDYIPLFAVAIDKAFGSINKQK